MKLRIAVTAIVALLIAAIFFSLFEVYKTTSRAEPSAAAEKNLYLAVDRWLTAEGHHVEYFEHGSAKNIIENKTTALIWSSSFDWKDSIELVNHIESGVNVVIFIDDEGSGELKEFLYEFNIDYRIYTPFENPALEDVEGALSSDEDTEAGGIEENTENVEDDDDEPVIFYDDDVYLRAEGGEQSHIVKIQAGMGSLSVTGIPYFMHWQSLINDKDISEAAGIIWELTGLLDSGAFEAEKNGESIGGIRIFRNKRSSAALWHEYEMPAFWERFFEYKHSVALCLCILAVIIIGFWMTLAPFGRFKPEGETAVASIEDRFRAEVRFFKKYKHKISVVPHFKK